MRRKIFNERFTVKMILAIVLISLIPTIFNSLIFHYFFSDFIKESVRGSSLQITQQVAESLSHILSTGSDMSTLIYSHRNIQDIVKSDLENNSQLQEEDHAFIIDYLNNQRLASTFVHSIYILKEEGSSWGSGNFSHYHFSQTDFNQLTWVKGAIEQDGALFWEGLQLEQFSGAGERTEYVLPISRTMKDFNNLNDIAFIQVLLDGGIILDRLSHAQIGEDGHFFVVDQQGKIMIDPNIENINQMITNRQLLDYVTSNEGIVEFEYQEEDMDYYGVKHPLPNDWMVIGIAPINKMTEQLSTMQYLIFTNSTLFALIAVAVGSLLSYRMTKPIKTLTKQMKQVGKGDLSVRTSVESSDEIGDMSLEFNRMIDKVESLLEQVHDEQEQKKEAELRAVRHRIDPHFLFNTLSAIRWLVTFKEEEKAKTTIRALMKLMEANMGKKGVFVTIEEELDIIDKFIDIMTIRYELNFQLKLDLNGNVKSFLIPQMLIQPIVENAIFHGIIPTNKDGIIEISARRLMNGVEIIVRNNGIGIDEDILKKLQDPSIREDNHKVLGIGLLHVFDSVYLYFSPDSKVEITNEEHGTKVKLILIEKNQR
ncbi:sensor histidine kinase [Globicatella sulfidifaciens]|uniref:Sensor histidine kinase n=1 Tax=Globicatella sulfidifaciens TaxID=136093 RepID=A0A7X8H176_9LACT|nr:sensor histidine kinase [Globicatella sulfidifaciens]NLJ19498.1 sensor histidine kinase [Globicatella sulfidifaciens]